MPIKSFPQGKITQIKGKCIALKGDDIDTDRIIPARFLKCVSFEALGEHVFADDRKEMQGQHPFDIYTKESRKILVVNNNFGCGSSREHAPQALMRWGIRAVIGVSFAEIFYGNCLALGIPCATSSSKAIKNIQNHLEEASEMNWTLDLIKKKLNSDKICFDLDLESGPYKMLTTGKWDATSQLIEKKDELQKVMKKLPYINNFKT